MPPYDELYDRPGMYHSTRPQRRWRSYRPAARARTSAPVPARYRAPERFPAIRAPRSGGRYLPYPRNLGTSGYDDDFGEYRPMGAVSEVQERMGMRDFSEQYGRYSGGSPYSYEYSERTIYHHPRFTGLIGFTRPLEETGYGEEYPYPHGRAGRYDRAGGYGRERSYGREEMRRGEGLQRGEGPYARGRTRGSFRPYTRWGRR